MKGKWQNEKHVQLTGRCKHNSLHLLGKGKRTSLLEIKTPNRDAQFLFRKTANAPQRTGARSETRPFCPHILLRFIYRRGSALKAIQGLMSVAFVRNRQPFQAMSLDSALYEFYFVWRRSEGFLYQKPGYTLRHRIPKSTCFLTAVPRMLSLLCSNPKVPNEGSKDLSGHANETFNLFHDRHCNVNWYYSPELLRN